MFKLYTLFILVPKFPELSFFWKFKTSSPPTAYYSSSLYILGIYALRVTLILPRVAHLNYLLRQQSENAYLNTKNRWILKFLRVFLDFLIFRILASFVVVWLSESTPWLEFLPGVAPESIWAWISHVFRFSCSYSVHAPFSRSTQLPQKSIEWTRNQDRTLGLYLI